MRLVTNVLMAIVLLFSSLFIFFMYKMSKPSDVTYSTSQVSVAEKQALTATISKLQRGYELRDVSKIDDCINNVMDTTSIFILGTSPSEVFSGRQGAYNLLWGDWKYWGDVKFNLNRLFADRMGDNMAYVVFPGTITIDVWKMTFPLQVSGVMVNDGGKWLFSKMQFQYAWNTNYVIFAKIAAIGTLFALVLLCIIQLAQFACSRRKAA